MLCAMTRANRVGNKYTGGKMSAAAYIYASLEGICRGAAQQRDLLNFHGSGGEKRNQQLYKRVGRVHRQAVM
jgi:hypothetical protein